MWQHLDNFDGGFDQALLTEIKQTQTKGKDPGEWVLEILLLLLQEDLSDALSCILIA